MARKQILVTDEELSVLRAALRKHANEMRDERDAGGHDSYPYHDRIQVVCVDLAEKIGLPRYALDL